MLEAISKQKAHYMKPHRNKNIAYFYAFLQDIRPEKSSDAASAELKIRDKINQLSSDSDALLVFQQHCKDLLLSSNIRNLFSDNMGVYSSDSLFQQLFKDIKHKILPPLEDKIHVSDLKIPEGVTLVTDGEEVIALAAAFVEEKEEAPVDLSAIEVVEKGKKEEEEATAE